MNEMFYPIFTELCKKRGVTVTRACIEAFGQSGKNAYARWKKKEADPSLEKLEQLSTYFGVSIDELVGKGKPATESDGFEEMSDKQKELMRLTYRLTDQEISLLLSQVKGIILGQ